MTYTKDNIVFEPLPNNSRFQDLTGMSFGLRTVIGYAGQSSSRHPYWWCQCECGTLTKSSACNLKNSVSCGCKNNIRIGIQATTHGMCTTATYKIWGCMVTRCNSENPSAYPDYAGRGIRVCDQWLKFENFYNDMGERPTPNHSLDRIDVNGNYCPENCRWATQEEQGNNRRNSVYLTFQGKTQTITQWARELNISPSALFGRRRKGLSDEEILTTPIKIAINREPVTSHLFSSAHLVAFSQFLFDLAVAYSPALSSERAVEHFLQELVGGRLRTERVLDLLVEHSEPSPVAD